MSGDSYFSKSMSATVELSDGITEISDGNITASSITTNNFTTSNFQASTLTDGYATIQNGNITGVNTLSCNSFITSTFSAANLAGDSITSTTSSSVFFNIIDLTSNIIGQYYNMVKYFTSVITTTAMSSGWKWYYNPSSTVCMTLDRTGNLQIGDDIRCLTSTDNIGCWNNHTGIIQHANLGDVASYNLLGSQVAGEIHIGEYSARTGIINIGCGSSATNDINLGAFSTGVQNINIGNYSTGTTQINNTLIRKNSLQSGSPTVAYNILTNQTSGAISIGSATVNVNITGTLKANNIKQVGTTGINIEGLNYNNLSITNNTPSSAVSILTNNTASVGLGGSGGVNLAKQVNQYVEVGTTASTNAYIDFHSSNNTVDYDTRIVATGGTATAGTGTLNIIANPLQLGGYTFRYIPWTTYVGTADSFNLAGIIYPAGANAPKCNSGATVSYRFTVIGNTMYINFYLYQASAGTGGNGIYQYQLPSGSVLGGLTYNTTDLVAMSNPTGSSVVGTKVGSSVLWNVGLNQEIRAVYFSNTGGNNGLTIWMIAGNGAVGLHGSALYTYAGANVVYTFEAMLPMN